MASISFTLSNLTRSSWLQPSVSRIDCWRWASKKTSGSSKNRPRNHQKPKHRGIKYNDGKYVHAGTNLVKQFGLRFHPGLNVGFGRSASLFAIESGRVVVTCEKYNPKWGHTWVENNYGARVGQTIYKKYFNVIPEEQHCRFKLVETV